MKAFASERLAEYMRSKGKSIICVEVATADHSDFDVAEIFVRFPKDSHLDYLVNQKNYRKYPLYIEETDTQIGTVLLPQYRMHVAECIYFDREKSYLWHKLTWKGLSL